MNKVMAFWRDEEGATAVEYGIIAGLMAMVLVAIFGSGGSFTGALEATFDYIGGVLPEGTTTPPASGG